MTNDDRTLQMTKDNPMVGGQCWEHIYVGRPVGSDYAANTVAPYRYSAKVMRCEYTHLVHKAESA